MLTLKYTPNCQGNTGGWIERHQAAVSNPKGPEAPIVAAVQAWLLYAEAHAARFESRIGDDGVLGPAWAQWGGALRRLLNGECGRLDCGTLDTILCRNLEEQGFGPDDL